MRLFSVLSNLALATAAAVAAASSAAATTSDSSTIDLVLQIGAPVEPNPNNQDAAAAASSSFFAQIPAWTRATLTAGDGRRFVSAPVTAGGALVFRDVPATAASYLGEVGCATFAFPPLRVDVSGSVETVSVTETFRGNDWANRGEALPRLTVPAPGTAAFLLRPKSAARLAYFTERSTFSALSVFKNPMILIMLVTMGLVFGMPKLVESMDPEMRAEFEAHQKQNPMNNVLSGGGNPNPAANFDMAAYLAGTNKPSSGSNQDRNRR